MAEQIAPGLWLVRYQRDSSSGEECRLLYEDGAPAPWIVRLQEADGAQIDAWRYRTRGGAEGRMLKYGEWYDLQDVVVAAGGNVPDEDATPRLEIVVVEPVEAEE